MRQTAARCTDGTGTQIGERTGRVILGDADPGREELTTGDPWGALSPVTLRGVQRVRVHRDLCLEQRHRVASTLLAEVVQREARPLPWMHHCAALNVRERE